MDHLPLEHQVRRMARSGLVVTSQALWDQLSYLGWVLMPTVSALHALILTAAVCVADETNWRQMTANGSKRRWVWLVSNGALVYLPIVPSRGEAAARELLRDFAGVLMADDYVVYRSCGASGPGAAARRVIARPGTVFLPTDQAEVLRAQAADAAAETPADDRPKDYEAIARLEAILEDVASEE